MKTASLILGIIGGALAVIFAIVFIAGGALVGSMTQSLDDFTAEMEAEGWEVTENDAATSLMSDVTGTAAGTFWLIGILSIVGAALGIVGGTLAKKNGILAGIFMLAAAVPSFFTGLGIIASVLFVVGGILAIIPQNNVQKAAA